MSAGMLSMDKHPSLLFAQLLHANIAAAHLMDIDGDGRQELIVAMTDRVGKIEMR